MKTSSDGLERGSDLNRRHEGKWEKKVVNHIPSLQKDHDMEKPIMFVCVTNLMNVYMLIETTSSQARNRLN